MYRKLVIMVILSLNSVAFGSVNSPNISANGLFLYRNSNFAKEDTDTVRNGLDLQEAELAFYSDVDPFSRLNLTLSIHPEIELESSTNKVKQNWIIEPEEAFAEINSLPDTILKMGKFKAAMGKHNQMHTHAFPFIDAPIANSSLLGDEGLNDIGLSAAVLLPFSWFSEVTGQYFRGEGENKEFNSDHPNDGVGLGHWKNLWDFSDSLTMELGGSYAQGANSMKGNTSLLGADVTFKWKPLSGGKYHSWVFAAEYLNRNLEQPGADSEKGLGWNIWSQFQLSEQWVIGVRYDHLKVEGADSTVNPNALDNISTKKYSAALIFTATEFSSYRLEYNQAEGPIKSNQSVERKIYLQANFTIGAHPSHTY